jgi:DNA-binding transcriptional ArsR family regulator
VWHDERPAGEIHAAMPDVTFGAVSQHLRSLSDAGLGTVRAEGRCRYYRARREAFGSVARLLEGMWTDALLTLKARAEIEEARRGPRAGTPRTRARRSTRRSR